MARRPLDLAQEALRNVDANPQEAVRLAGRAAAAARGVGDREAESVAARALGLAEFYLHDADTAVVQLRHAVRLGQQAGSRQRVGEARMTLAYVEKLRGHAGPAMRLINMAVADTSGVVHARAVAQRGAIHYLSGRTSAAMADYRTALPVLRHAKDRLWQQRVLTNRGVVHTDRRELTAARTDLLTARKLGQELGLGLMTAIADQNLGTLATFSGDIPEALAYYGEAEARFRELGSLVGSVLMNRAELLLSTRLIPEAREAAELAIADFQHNKLALMIANARLLLARIAQIDGDLSTARREARRAAVEFERAGRHQWASLAHLTVAGLGAASRRPATPITGVMTFADAAGELRPEIALEALITRAREAIGRKDQDGADHLLLRASAYRTRGPATVRARAWYAEAIRRQVRGERRGSLSAARAGLNILDQFGAALGATDLRANVAAHRVELARLGLESALRDKSAASVLSWAERGKASHLMQPRTRPAHSPRLARALAELRAVTHQLDEAAAQGATVDNLARKRREAERQVRELTWRGRGRHGESTRSHDRAHLTQTLKNRVLVEYIQSGGDLYAVTVADGRHRLRRLTTMAEVAKFVPRVPFALHRLQRRGPRTSNATAARELLRATTRTLDALLMAPLAEVADRPIVIVPTGVLHKLPWALLPTCHGRPVTIVPTAAIWATAMSRTHPVGGGAVVVAGPNLPGAREEARSVAAIHGVRPLLDAEASVDAVIAQLDGARVVHLAAHGHVRSDSPQFGSLTLADGPMMIYDLEQVRRAPHTLVLAACDAGSSVGSVGDELLGLTVTLLAQGSAQLIAPLLPVLDVETRQLMTSLHHAITSGQAPAVALAAAQQRIEPDLDRAAAAAAAFVCFGAGFRPVPGAQSDTGRRYPSPS